MLNFAAESIPRKGSKKVKMHKCIFFSFSLLTIFFSCRPSVELQEEFGLFPVDTASTGLFYLSLNEILFDPVPQSCDYVEIVNRSPFSVDLSKYVSATATKMGYWAVPNP